MSSATSVTNAVLRFFRAIDERDWTTAQTFMTNPFRLDYSSFGARAATTTPPGVVLAGWRDLLPGFDATHHQLGSMDIELEDAAAQVSACVTASHFIDDAPGGNHWTVLGRYQVELMRSDASWNLTALTFQFSAQHGNTTLADLARQRAG